MDLKTAAAKITSGRLHSIGLPPILLTLLRSAQSFFTLKSEVCRTSNQPRPMDRKRTVAIPNPVITSEPAR